MENEILSQRGILLSPPEHSLNPPLDMQNVFITYARREGSDRQRSEIFDVQRVYSMLLSIYLFILFYFFFFFFFCVCV